MKIRYVNNERKIPFYSLPLGAVFKDNDGNVFIKIATISGANVNAVDLESGHIAFCADATWIYPVENAELVIS